MRVTTLTLHAALALAFTLTAGCGSDVATQTTAGAATGATSGSTGTGGGSSIATTSGASTATSSGSSTSSGSGGSGGTGTSTGGATGTGGGDAIYSAYVLPTDLPRYVVFKSEPAANRCVELWVSMAGGGGIGIDAGADWTVDRALVTAHASDCAVGANGDPIITMMSTNAKSGTGTLTGSPNSFQPCSVSIHATVTFPTGSPWAPPSDTFNVDGLKLMGPGSPCP